MGIDPSKRYTATMETSLGTIVIALDAINAPITVNNFVFLAAHHYYDGVIFHRIINGFMCQGGDPQGTGTGGPGYKFQDEPVKQRYQLGSVAMANAGPNTNGSQFFLISGQSGVNLPPQYNHFGQIVKGLDVLDAMQRVSDRPRRPAARGRGDQLRRHQRCRLTPRRATRRARCAGRASACPRHGASPSPPRAWPTVGRAGGSPAGTCARSSTRSG